MAEASEHTQLTSAFSLFTKSKDLVLDNLSLFIPLYILPFIFQLLPAFTDNTATQNTNSIDASYLDKFSAASMVGLVGFGVAILFITILAMIFIQVMLYSLELKVSANKKTNFKKLWHDAKHYWLRLLGLGIVVGLLFVGGIVLLIVPALIVLRRYFLAPYYLIDKDLQIGDAMRMSANESKKYSGSVWGVIGVSVLIGAVGIVPIFGPWISFVLMVLYSVAPALRYREIRALS